MPDQSWLRHYPEWVPQAVTIHAETVLTMFAQSVEKFPRRPALSFFGKTLSYRECHAFIERFACSLVARGISKGDRVALCLPNSPQAVIAYYGILRAGGVVVACNPSYTEYELSRQLAHAGARAIVVLDAMYHKIQHLDLSLIIVTRITDFMSLTARFLYRVRNSRPSMPIPRRETTMSFRHALDKETAISRESLPSVTADDLALLQHTGGKMGGVLAAELSHGNLSANSQQLINWFAPVEGAERFLAALPLYHVFAMTVTQNTCLSVGGCMVLVPDPRDVTVLLRVVRKTKPTVITLVPALVRKLVDICQPTDFVSAKFCVTGAAPLPFGLLKKFKERTGQLLIEGYGLTEASPVTHCNIPHGLSVKGSIGLPIPHTEAKVVDEAGCDVPVGAVGELWVRGPQVMRGYWQNPEETANVLKPDGWLATGDLAYMDPDGFFYLVDRKKEMILSSSGFNVYPSEIEHVLLLHPHVKDAAVIGVPHGEGSELIKAFVVHADHTVSANELVSHCRRYLAPYKVPKKIEFRAELPRTTHGKTRYQLLRMEEAEQLARQGIGGP